MTTGVSAESNGNVTSRAWRGRMARRALLIAGIVAMGVYVVADLLSGLLYEGYSFADQAISELVGLVNSVRLRGLRILVDQTAQDRAPSDSGSGQVSHVRRWIGRPLAQRAMRPMFVVMTDVLGQHGGQVPLADDEYPVGAFPAYGAHPALRD
jgi:hypothetical protein